MVGIAFLLLLSVQFVSGSKCETNWAEFRGRYYCIFYDKLTWKNATLHCDSLNGQLAQIDDSELNDWLQKQMKGLSIGYMWIGASSLYTNDYTWVPSGITLMPYQNWTQILVKPHNPETDRCALLNSHDPNKWWSKGDCYQDHAFICMKKLFGPRCDLDFYNFKGKCYWFSTNLVEWELAVVLCNQLGADLVEIDNPELNNWLALYVTYLNYFNKNVSWIGGSTLYSDGSWVWIATHNPMFATFLNWHPRERTKRHRSKGGVLLGARNGFWNTQVESGHHRFVCEKYTDNAVYTRLVFVR